jgi:hypothetical protein
MNQPGNSLCRSWLQSAFVFGKRIDVGAEFRFAVASIPAKPLAPAKLKCGGFFIARKETTTGFDGYFQNQ